MIFGGFSTLKGLNLCFNIMNVKLCLLNQELGPHFLIFNYFSFKIINFAAKSQPNALILLIFVYFLFFFYVLRPI